MDDVIKNLKELSGKYETELSTIREKLRILDAVPKAQALSGKCFKYRNGFTFGGNRKGWVYKRVIGVVGENLIVDTFEFEGNGNKFEIKFNEIEYVNRFAHPAFKQIKLKEYFKQFNKLVRIIKKRGNYGF